MATCNKCGTKRGLKAARDDDGKPDLAWCCLYCGKIWCRGCMESLKAVGYERRCTCGELITINQRIDNNQAVAW